jgi:predicted nucleotide-binding protein (sugar kinase/HSP70/actin superfamily)
MREIQAGLDAIRAANPNLVDRAAHEVWKSRSPLLVADSTPSSTWRKSVRDRIALMNSRPNLRIGIPRVLNMYAYAPLFSAYLESLGVRPENIVYSDFTTDEMYRSGSSRGSIDPCFPSKITIAHFHNLIYTKHCRRPLQAIFIPMFDVLCSPLVRTRACNACPTVAVTPETVGAAYTKEIDVFAQQGIQYLHPLVNLSDRRLFARQMFRCWAPLLGLSEEENARAVEAGYAAWKDYERSIRKRAREALDLLERENRLGVVMLGRPYHHDPGLNHGIFEEFQKLGYPVFSQSTLPLDEDLLERLFGDEVRAGTITHPLDISDVWKTATAASSNLKIWAAKFTARHPNLVAVEISSFKCGHDAPIYTLWSNPAHRTSVSRIWTKTNPSPPSSFAWKPLTTF